MSQRTERISEEFQKALAECIRTLKDPLLRDLMISVTRCEVTGDLRYAKAYISVFGSEQQKKDAMRGLKSASGYLRREVAAKIRLRYAPEIVLIEDDSIGHGAHINQLLNDLEREGKL